MTTLEMEIAVINHLNPRRNLIVPNVSWGIRYKHLSLHECDILSLSKTGFATEIEIKISKQDLLKDKDKLHGHTHPLIKYFWYAVPEHLEELALQEIPSKAGLLVVRKVKYYLRGYQYITYVLRVRNAKAIKNSVKWDSELRYKLARLGTLRIVKMKADILKLKE